ncbi:MAG: 1-acyl-sn-glycerol-3-phosphate acyltransferase [Bacteroidales bacterium]|nr:1-acyl-sn-glycerol-3-phosphate acyltransferase [Bacteroidales bacterium]
MYKRETIDKWSKLYWLLQVFFVGPTYRFYFKKFQVYNRDKVPREKSVILAPNHQNALMDALSFVAGTPWQTVFLMRADVFRGGFVEQILTFIKTLPIFRIRDGRSTLQKNDEIFDFAVQVLHNQINPLCMFPEGNHGDKRRLRPLVKGIFRIAFKAQEKFGSEPGVKIITVGLDYSHYQRFRQTLFMNFGSTVEVSEYWNDYLENPSVAMNKLRDRLAGEMKKVMINIETEEYYDLYMGLRSLFSKKFCRADKLKQGNLMHRFQTDKKMIASLDKCLEKEPDRIKKLGSKYDEYLRLRKKLNFRDWVPDKKRYSIIGNIAAVLISAVTWPLVLLGLFNNWPNFFLPVHMRKKIKDAQFHSTATWGTGVVIMVIYYFFLSITAIIILPYWWLVLLYIITLPSSGIFMLDYRKFVIKSYHRIRYSLGRISKNPEVNKFKSVYDEIFHDTGEIMKAYA